MNTIKAFTSFDCSTLFQMKYSAATIKSYSSDYKPFPIDPMMKKNYQFVSSLIPDACLESPTGAELGLAPPLVPLVVQEL